MKHLKLWQKLAMLGGLFMVPLAVVLRQSDQVIDGLNQAATGMRQGASRFKVAA